MTKFIDGLKVQRREFNNGDYIFSLNLKFDTFVDCIGDLINDKGYVNIDICKSKTTDKWYCKLNEWQPKGSK